MIFFKTGRKITWLFINELNPDYKKGFTIYDSSDQTRLLKDTIKSLDLDLDQFTNVYEKIGKQVSN